MISILKGISQDHVKANQFQAMLRFGITFLISVLLVKSGLSDGEVGLIEYVLLAALTASFFWAFAFTNGTLSYIPKHKEDNYASILSQLFWQNVVIALLMAGLTFVLSPYIFNLLDKEIEPELFIWLACLVFLMISGVWAEVYYLIYQRAKGLIIYGTLIYIVQLIIILYALYLSANPILIIKAYVLWQAIKFVWGICLIKPRFVKVEWNLQKSYFLLILPLCVHFLLGSGMDYMDGHIIAYFFSEEEFLYYRYGARELPISILFINAMSAALIPVMAKDIVGNIATVKQRIVRLMRWIIPVSIIFIFTSKLLFTWVYSDAFALSSEVFNIYILIVSSRLLLAHIFMYAHGDNQALMWFSGMELLINFALSIWFLQLWGIAGVAWATVIAYLINSIACMLYAKSKYGIRIHQYLPIREYSLWMLSLVAAFVVNRIWLA